MLGIVYTIKKNIKYYLMCIILFRKTHKKKFYLKAFDVYISFLGLSVMTV